MNRIFCGSSFLTSLVCFFTIQKTVSKIIHVKLETLKFDKVYYLDSYPTKCLSVVHRRTLLEKLKKELRSNKFESQVLNQNSTDQKKSVLQQHTTQTVHRISKNLSPQDTRNELYEFITQAKNWAKYPSITIRKFRNFTLHTFSFFLFFFFFF